jgi:hypothetical protein
MLIETFHSAFYKYKAPRRGFFGSIKSNLFTLTINTYFKACFWPFTLNMKASTCLVAAGLASFALARTFARAPFANTTRKMKWFGINESGAEFGDAAFLWVRIAMFGGVLWWAAGPWWADYMY